MTWNVLLIVGAPDQTENVEFASLKQMMMMMMMMMMTVILSGAKKEILQVLRQIAPGQHNTTR